MTVKRKSMKMMAAEALKIRLNLFGGMRLVAMAKKRNNSEQIQTTARKLIEELSNPPGKNELKTTSSESMKFCGRKYGDGSVRGAICLKEEERGLTVVA